MPGSVNAFCINKSGSQYNIYDYDGSNNSYTYVGKLNNRESYIVNGGEGQFVGITFLNSSGQLKTALINNNTHPLPGYNSSYGWPVNSTCLNYPYGTVTLDGVTYKTFKMRSSKPVYLKNGQTVWGHVASGCLVATNSYKIGETYPYLKLIHYVQSSSGNCVRVDNNGAKYGFVDTGLRSASGYSSIPFYGSW